MIKLKGWERSIDKAWREAGELAIADRVPAMLTIWKVYDGLLDRRRILCGDPLPRGGGSKTASRMIELEPQSIPADAMPEAAQADPVAGVD